MKTELTEKEIEIFEMAMTSKDRTELLLNNSTKLFLDMLDEESLTDAACELRWNKLIKIEDQSSAQLNGRGPNHRFVYPTEKFINLYFDLKEK